MLDDAAAYLSSDFENENFRFNSAILRGVQEQQPRWKRVLHVTDEGIGQALGQLYVADHFPPEAKARALAMVNDLKDALRERINAVDWMGPQTKAAAVKKLEVLGVKIGYPDKWRDYSALEIKNQPYVLNAVACRAFEFKRRLARIGQPVDPNEWDMTPPTINAYYDPNRNEVVFPAGILQPPNFDLKADDAANYGNTGATIGHEMTHGFDDQGRQYDGQGNLKNWWSFVDLKRFEERGQKIVKQFAEFEPQPGLHVNGKLTEGENIADLGGLKIAYIAFQKARARLPAAERDKVVDGMTPDQRFFVSYAQSWRGIKRPEAVRLQVLSDPHSPEIYRVNGPVANLPEFAQAFGLPAPCPEMRPGAGAGEHLVSGDAPGFGLNWNASCSRMEAMKMFPMTSRRPVGIAALLALAVCLLLAASGCSKKPAPTSPRSSEPAPAPSASNAPTEQRWIIGAIARDLANMATFAAGSEHWSGLPADAMDVHETAGSEPGQRYSLTIRLRGGEMVTSDLQITGSVWSPELYVPTLHSIFAQLKLSPPAAGGDANGAQEGEDLLKILATPLTADIETQNQRISAELQRHPLDARAHEQAALLLGTLAMRENSGLFWNPRGLCNRAVAHLAFARALRPEVSECGEVAELLVGLIIDTKADCAKRIAALQSRVVAHPELGPWRWRRRCATPATTACWRSRATPRF